MEQNQIFHDRYKLMRLIGRGAFAEVWLAMDNYTKVNVALKIFVPIQDVGGYGVKLMSREFSVVANLNHENLLRPIYYDTFEGKPYLVLPYCEKGNCVKLIGTFTEEDAWKMLHDISSALAYLHSQEPTPIIHQDIKPDNILIGPSGQFLLSDFGVSNQTLKMASINPAVGAGNCCYKGPEFFSKDKEPIKSSDIYSLGATVYELLTGDPPFGDAGGLMQLHGCEVPRLPERFSDGLNFVMASCLNKDSWNRPTAETLVQWAEMYGAEHLQHIDDVGVSQAEGTPDSFCKKTNDPYKAAQKNKNRKNVYLAASIVLGICFVTVLVILMSTERVESNDHQSGQTVAHDYGTLMEHPVSAAEDTVENKEVIMTPEKKSPPKNRDDYGEVNYVSESYVKTVELKEKQDKELRAKKIEAKKRKERKKQKDIMGKLEEKIPLASENVIREQTILRNQEVEIRCDEE